MCVNPGLGCWAMGCSDVMSGDAGCVIMDTDEMQHAGCRNSACDLSWWPLLMNFSFVEEERGSMLVPGRLWVLGLGSNCEILVCCELASVQTLQCVLWGEGGAVEQEGGNTQWKYWDRVWRLGSFPPPPPPPSPTPHSCCININKYIGRLANSLH